MTLSTSLYILSAVFSFVFGVALLAPKDGQRSLNLILAFGCLVVLMVSLYKLGVIFGVL